MKIGFYPKMAAEGMMKNSRKYMPYLATCILMTAVYYIMHFLGFSGIMDDMPCGGTATEMLQLGTYIMTLFGLIFLFYTNATLIKGRKKEFGLYSILGMNKRDIARILFFETVISWGVAVAGGLVAGIGLSKLAELGFTRMIAVPVRYTFSISIHSLLTTIAVYSGIFLLIFLNTVRQIGLASPMELVRADKEGEKPPKAKWFLGLLGIAFLGIGYLLAIRIQQPMAALMWFFVAVILVIIGTYLLLISGSVLLCTLLKKNKSYYYKTSHFVSVSSMLYRMKRNGAALASICILLTAILVMLSSTAALYTGADECLNNRYPQDINAFACKYGYEKSFASLDQRLRNAALDVAAKKGIRAENMKAYSEYSISGYFEDSYLDICLNSQTNMAFINYEKVAQIEFIDLEEYNRVFGHKEKLENGEALVGTVKDLDIGQKIMIGDVAFKVAKRIDESVEEINPFASGSASPEIFVIVNDVEEVAKNYIGYRDYDGSPMLAWFWHCSFDTKLNTEEQTELASSLGKAMHEELDSLDFDNMYCVAKNAESKDFVSTFGGLFFLGILLSLIFLVACVIIMYYKQISEGYEDQSRFEIMQKLGMTKDEIRKSVNSQMLTVFLIPIAFACLHLAVCLPVISKLLILFGLFNMTRILACAGVCCLLCTIFYAAVYKVTSNAYVNIVS